MGIGHVTPTKPKGKGTSIGEDKCAMFVYPLMLTHAHTCIGEEGFGDGLHVLTHVKRIWKKKKKKTLLNL